MNNQQKFRDKFMDYLSRRLRPNQIQNIMYSSQKNNNNSNMNLSSPKQHHQNNQILSSPYESSINSSAISFTCSNRASEKNSSHYDKTKSIKKRKLMKVRQIQQNVCSICLQNYKNRVKMSCGHFFCYQCLNQWLNTSSRCPYCRTDCPYYVMNGKNIQIQQKQYQHHAQQIDEGLDYQCYMCQQTNQGDEVLICDGCGLYACHIRCDPRLRGRVPDEQQQWFCHFC